jgi:1-acyl-sn-glycerol-3-phosphate acyltransferase
MMSLITRAYRRGVILLDRFLMLIYIRRFDVEGRENVPPQGPLIVASNHLNNADPPMVAAALPRHPTFMAKQEMFGWPILGLGIRAFGAFPVRRFEADLGALRKAVQVVREGKMLIMFPEGTRSRTGSMRKAHPGTAMIALRAGAPILPIAITGTETTKWPWLFLRPFMGPKVRVVIGRPFFLPEMQRIDAEAAHRCTEIIMRRIAELLPESYRGYYARAEGEPEEAARDVKGS